MGPRDPLRPRPRGWCAPRFRRRHRSQLPRRPDASLQQATPRSVKAKRAECVCGSLSFYTFFFFWGGGGVYWFSFLRCSLSLFFLLFSFLLRFQSLFQGQGDSRNFLFLFFFFLSFLVTFFVPSLSRCFAFTRDFFDRFSSRAGVSVFFFFEEKEEGEAGVCKHASYARTRSFFLSLKLLSFVPRFSSNLRESCESRYVVSTMYRPPQCQKKKKKNG